MFFKLGTRNKHHKRRKMTTVLLLPWQQLCRWSCFIRTKIPRFYLKQGSSTPNTLMGRVNTIWEPCVFGVRPSVPLQRVGNEDVWFSTERDWGQECCHGNNLEGIILFLLWCTSLVPSLKNTAPMFVEILLIECCTGLVEPSMTSSMTSSPHLHNTKT